MSALRVTWVKLAAGNAETLVEEDVEDALLLVLVLVRVLVRTRVVAIPVPMVLGIVEVAMLLPEMYVTVRVPPVPVTNPEPVPTPDPDGRPTEAVMDEFQPEKPDPLGSTMMTEPPLPRRVVAPVG